MCKKNLGCAEKTISLSPQLNGGEPCSGEISLNEIISVYWQAKRVSKNSATHSLKLFTALGKRQQIN